MIMTITVMVIIIIIIITIMVILQADTLQAMVREGMSQQAFLHEMKLPVIIHQTTQIEALIRT